MLFREQPGAPELPEEDKVEQAVIAVFIVFQVSIRQLSPVYIYIDFVVMLCVTKPKMRKDRFFCKKIRAHNRTKAAQGAANKT